jgi:hypothetical protein
VTKRTSLGAGAMAGGRKFSTRRVDYFAGFAPLTPMRIE